MIVPYTTALEAIGYFLNSAFTATDTLVTMSTWKYIVDVHKSLLGALCNNSLCHQWSGTAVKAKEHRIEVIQNNVCVHSFSEQYFLGCFHVFSVQKEWKGIFQRTFSIRIICHLKYFIALDGDLLQIQICYCEANNNTTESEIIFSHIFLHIHHIQEVFRSEEYLYILYSDEFLKELI